MSYGNYPDLEEVKKVLVIKLRHLGDVLLTSSVFSCLKQVLPKAKIDAYIYKDSLPMLLGHKDIDDIITYDSLWKKSNFIKRSYLEWQLLSKIKKQNYDLVINLTEGDRGAIACKFSSSPIKVGFDPSNSGMRGKKNIFSHVVKQTDSPRHAVEKNLDALRIIGINPEEKSKSLFFSVPTDAKKKMEALLLEKGFENYILIHPCSRWRFKCWSKEKFNELIRQLLLKKEKIVIVCGKEDYEKELTKQILNGLDLKNILDLSGEISLKELGALIQMSKALVCIDSVTLHMASSLKAPCVSIFGPTSNLIWGPWRNPNSQVVYKNLSCRPCCQDGCGGSKISDCLVSLPVDNVMNALDTVINKRKDISVVKE